MSSLINSAGRAVRSPTSGLRALSVAPAAGRVARRTLHESKNRKAVEASVGITKSTPPAFHPPPAPAPVTPAQRAQAAATAIRHAGTPPLNILEEAYKPSFYKTVAEIMKIREKYVEERAIFVEGKEMARLLKGLGAREEDMPGLENSSDVLARDPTLAFRKSRSLRLCIDFDTNTMRRLEFQPFTLTAEEDFKRHDSGALRRFDEILPAMAYNTVLQALFVFKAMMIHGVDIAHRPLLEYDSNKWVSTLFSLRTITTPDLLGEPALEGVHSDGVDHTMTTFMKAKNMTANSAATFFHSMDETTGVPNAQLNPEHLLGRVQHRNFLDTLMIVDHERKHSLSPVHAKNPTEEALRDMLVFFTRKPVHPDHVSGGIDSLVPHGEMPLECPIFVPPYAKSE